MEYNNKLETERMLAIARALADPYQFAILQQIAANHTFPSSTLYASDPFRPATITHHIRELRQAGLIEVAQTGPSPSFKLARGVWRAYIRELAGFARGGARAHV